MTFSCFLTSISLGLPSEPEAEAEVDAVSEAESDGGVLCDRRTLRSRPARSDRWSRDDAAEDSEDAEEESMDASTMSSMAISD